MIITAKIPETMKGRIVARLLEDGATEKNEEHSSIEALIQILLVKYLKGEIKLDLQADYKIARAEEDVAWGKHKSIGTMEED
ncbi:MAG: hypothetical protein ACNYWU_05825 [Desulfobacterales bacterium]